MGTPYAAFITLVVTSGVFNVLMGIYVLFSKFRFSGARTFVALSLLSAIYSFGSALELGSGSLAEIKLWIKIEYLGMPFLAPLELILVLQYLGMERHLKRNLRIALMIIPAITLMLVLTNEAHQIFYRGIESRRDTLTPKADVIGGPWYIIHGAYTCACMMGSAILLLRSWKRMKAYRGQMVIMLFGLLLPLVGDFVYLGGLTPDGMDPIPVLMSVTSGLYLWALTSTGLFNVVPIARDNLFESMNDGVLVLDMEHRLVDYNAAAATFIPELSTSLVGQRLNEIWSRHTDEPLRLPEAEQQADMLDQEKQEVYWRTGSQEDYYMVRSSFVRIRNGQAAGKLIVMTNITERRRLQEELRQLAYHDGLTHIYNRLHFFHLSEALLDEAARSGSAFSLVLFDIDHFKRINDDYGHVTGDQALLHIVQVCQRVLRSEDVFARYGGEEFVIAMPNLTLEQAGEATQRIRREVAAHPLRVPQGELSITASFGVVQASSAYETLEQLLRQADQALYRSKHSGRDTVHLAAAEEFGR